TLERERTDLTTQLNSEEKAVRNASDEGNNASAKVHGSMVVQLRDQVAHKEQQIETQKQTSAALDASVLKIQTKYRLIVGRISELETIDRTSKDKERAADTMQKAERLASAGGDISVDDIESKIRARGDVADEKFRRATDGLEATSEPDSRVD